MPAALPHGVIRNLRLLPETLDHEGPKSPPALRVSELASGTARMIDTYVYDYSALVGDNAPFATVEAGAGVRVAVVGSGFAGLVAAAELRRANIPNVTIFEAATDDEGKVRIGGRVLTSTFHDSAGREYVNELGPMRVPENSKLFWHYVSKVTDPDELLHPFPNPGVVSTQLLYAGEPAVEWLSSALDPNQRGPSGPWATLSEQVVAFIESLTVSLDEPCADQDNKQPRDPNDPRCLSVTDVAAMLKQDTLSEDQRRDLHTFWSCMLRRYDGWTFSGALADYFDGEDGRPYWGPDEFSRFATLGLGTGGFGPLYPIAFTEILRLLIWEYQAEYSPSIPMDEVTQRLHQWGGAKLVGGKVRFVGRSDDAAHVYLEGQAQPEVFDYVVVATTLRSMQVNINLDASRVPRDIEPGVEPAFDDPQLHEALRVPHIVSSSKLFGFLPRKPWLDDDTWPHVVGASGEREPVKCILTDTLARQMYLLDPYPDSDTAGLNVLVSYNWGDDAVRHQGLGLGHPDRPKLLLDAYRRALETASGGDEPAAQMLGAIGALSNIDWQLEPLTFGGFKLNYPRQYRAQSRLVYQYQDDNRVFIANNNCSYQGGWIEGALQSGVNAASAVLHALTQAGLATEFRMGPLFEPNPFQNVVDDIARIESGIASGENLARAKACSERRRHRQGSRQRRALG